MKRIFSLELGLAYCAVLGLLLSACSRGPVLLPTSQATEAIFDEQDEGITPTATEDVLESYPLQKEYAVVWIPRGESLLMRKPAGISSPVIEELSWDARQISLTGNWSMLGSSLWVEIIINSGKSGWVNSWYITEAVSEEAFCEDQRVHDLLESFKDSITNLQETELSQLISPNHGLTIRLNWYNPDVHFSIEEYQLLLSDEGELEWGVMEDSGFPVYGTFREVIQPKLEDVFLTPYEESCTRLQWGNTSGEVLWPDELKNINFYSFHRPAQEDGNSFDWRTWAVGIEYVNHQPYIAILIHYSSEL
jgi:hypothetical protein